MNTKSTLQKVTALLSETVVLTNDLVDGLTNADVTAACKARGIEYGELSYWQMKQALINFKPEEMTMAKAKKTVAKKTTRKGNGESKMDKALVIYNENKKLPRKDVIKLFIDKVSLSKAGASTYYQLCKNKSK